MFDPQHAQSGNRDFDTFCAENDNESFLGYALEFLKEYLRDLHAARGLMLLPISRRYRLYYPDDRDMDINMQNWMIQFCITWEHEFHTEDELEH